MPVSPYGPRKGILCGIVLREETDYPLLAEIKTYVRLCALTLVKETVQSTFFFIILIISLTCKILNSLFLPCESFVKETGSINEDEPWFVAGGFLK